jgi:glucans biosynthesis protein
LGAALLIPSRRAILALLSGACVVANGSTPAQTTVGTTKGFSYDNVVRQAATLAKQNFNPESAKVPAELSKLTYDSYREIRWRREKSFWRDGASDFRLLPFHLGFLNDKPVQVHTINHGNAIPIPVTTSLFECGKVPVPKGLSPSLGFAGFAVTTNVNNPKLKDEVISFFGASYFHLIGRGHRCGLSARSLALDVGGNEPEEFPFMRALWVEEPSRDSTELVIYALLDSPSVAGAYRYVVTPGRHTCVDVTATHFPRNEIERIGIAPLTSMFQVGASDLSQRTDVRPEIHDSDGLMTQSGSGEWIWRPIRNPKALRISSFGDKNPRGFGLIQRDRDFGSYQDLEARYDARPSNFGGGDLDFYQNEPERLELGATTGGTTTSQFLAFHGPSKGVRAIVDATLPDGQSAELRMFLRTRNRTLSETWTATWSVPPGDAARTQPPTK